MNPNLAKMLVQRGVIRQGTVLEAYQSAKSLSCVYDSFAISRYVVLGASTSGEWVYFNVASDATERHRIRCDFVSSIDGMEIERVAAAHQLREDGSVIKPTSRRGRGKRKKPTPALPAPEPIVEAFEESVS